MNRFKQTVVSAAVADLQKNSNDYHRGTVDHDTFTATNLRLWQAVERLGWAPEVREALRRAS